MDISVLFHLMIFSFYINILLYKNVFIFSNAVMDLLY